MLKVSPKTSRSLFYGLISFFFLLSPNLWGQVEGSQDHRGANLSAKELFQKMGGLNGGVSVQVNPTDPEVREVVESMNISSVNFVRNDSTTSVAELPPGKFGILEQESGSKPRMQRVRDWLTHRSREDKLANWIKGELDQTYKTAHALGQEVKYEVVTLPSESHFSQRELEALAFQLGWTESPEKLHFKKNDTSSETSSSNTNILDKPLVRNERIPFDDLELYKVIKQVKQLSDSEEFIIGKLPKKSMAYRVSGSLIKMTLTSGVILATFVLQAPGDMIIQALERSGLAALVGGTMSGAIQFYKNKIDQYQKMGGFFGRKFDSNGKELRGGWGKIILKQLAISFTFQFILRNVMWATDMVSYEGMHEAILHILKVSSDIAPRTVLAQLPFLKIFADASPHDSEKTPRAYAIKRKNARWALVMSFFLVTAEVLFQSGHTLAADFIFGSLGLTGATLLFKINADKFMTSLKHASLQTKRRYKNAKRRSQRFFNGMNGRFPLYGSGALRCANLLSH